MRILAIWLAACPFLMAEGEALPTAMTVDETWHELVSPRQGPFEVAGDERWNDFRLLVEYDAGAEAAGSVRLFGDHEILLPAGQSRRVEIACEHAPGRDARVRVWHDGILVDAGRDVPGTAPRSGSVTVPQEGPAADLPLDGEFTVLAKFRTTGGGTLVAKAAPDGEWEPDAKALFVRDGRLVYDIGWHGAVTGKTVVHDGSGHLAVLVVRDGTAQLFVDGTLEAERKGFTRPDRKGHVFKLGSAADNFGGDFQGDLLNVRFWKRALDAGEVARLGTGKEDEVNTPDFHWQPPADEAGSAFPGTTVTIAAGGGFRLKRAAVQALAASDHGEMIGAWSDEGFERGKAIYRQLCVTCHGTVEQPGTLPTALRFHEGRFKNGNDPYRMFQTLEKGFGMMVAQPQYSTQQKYDVIHYVREEFLKERNPSQYAPVDEDYLAGLPRGRTLRKEQVRKVEAKPYKRMDFGNVLFWTLQVEKGNIAQKGIAVRVDPGPGGISKGKAWMLYDHDTMRLAACWTGDEFVDWRGIAFDGSHGTHTSIVGNKRFVFPNEPMWANPETGKYEDVRIRGRDGKPYGPLPREWVRFRGLHVRDGGPILEYSVGGRAMSEIARWDARRQTFVRVLRAGPSARATRLRLDAEAEHVIPPSESWGVLRMTLEDGGWRVEAVPDEGIAAVEREGGDGPADGIPVRFGAEPSPRFPGILTTTIERGSGDGSFAVDVLTTPAPGDNPWQSWMRTSGFDFFADGRRAAVCTWNGDVWIVEGIDRSEGELQWRRICAGLFQPLGLKIVDGEIFVGCRDMIARLRDTDGDGETDHIECFNNDHQVTEHFHEFAMGLQTDAAGNFYYAKSARHALKAVVPHHGTLLRVSKDGSRTDILATGFRAANGVCLNPDGSFIVTDQEGHWNPKNRINWVQGTGTGDFYGNMYGYHAVTDDSDEAMNPPLCWITNAFDRSPAELLWVPENSAWGALRGSLLNFSYGYGKIYVVPHEKRNGTMQGGMCQLPIGKFPTGVMRGRFHPGDGQLYTCGMFAWAGSQHQPGGFYRVRATGKPAWLPTGLQARDGRVRITFTDALDAAAAADPGNYTVEAWDLKRTRNYGSKHYNQRKWPVGKVEVSSDGRSVDLHIPELAPTWGMSITCRLEGPDGEEFERVIHNTIHVLGGQLPR